MTKASPAGWVILCVLAAAFLLAAAIAPGPAWVAPLCLVTGLACAVAAGVLMVHWIASLWIGLLYNYRVAESKSERVALLTQLARMDQQQIDFANRYVPRLEMAAGDAGPAVFLRVEGGSSIPMDFIHAFIDEGQDEWMCPVRRYSEGSIQRTWAEQFVTWCIWMGYAAEAGGNRPARWIARDRALTALGITDKTLGAGERMNPYNLEG